MERIKPYDEIIEFPITFESENQTPAKEFQVNEVLRTSENESDYKLITNQHYIQSNDITPEKLYRYSISNSQNTTGYKKSLKKSKSKDSLGYKEINCSSSNSSAYRNSPWNDMLAEYYKNKSQLDKRYQRAMTKH